MTRHPRHLGTLGQAKVKQSRGGSKRRSAGRFSEAGYPLRAPNAHLLVKYQSGELADAVQLTSPSSQDNPSACDLVEPAGLQTVANELKGFLDTRSDNADEQGFWHVIDMALVFFADLRDGDHLALVGACRASTAEKGFHTFGMG